MNRFFYFVFLLLSSPPFLKAQTVKIFYENKDQGFILYANNSELFPVSINLNVDMSNLSFSEGKRKVFVLPAKTEKLKIGELTAVENGKRYKFGFAFKATIGDVTISDYDQLYEYDLPYKTGRSYLLHQGYNGAFSHQNENSLDFSMPEGSEILAAREGQIVQIIENNTESCAREDCKKYNNYITIMHSDGSFASYVHIQYNGSKVKLGVFVQRGQPIAYSGNTGYTNGPHLHFVCFLGAFEKMNSLATKFRIEKGDKAIYLAEKNTYTREY